MTINPTERTDLMTETPCDYDVHVLCCHDCSCTCHTDEEEK